jgi:predicted Zn-dependent peptidase
VTHPWSWGAAVGFIRNLDRVRPIENVRKAVLPSGLTVLVEEVPHVRSLTVGIWVLTGSQDEPAELSGISHFIEHMVFKGTRRSSALDIAKRTEAIGGQLDAFTSREHTCYYARIFEEHLEKAIEILGDLVSRPLFEREMIIRERGVIVEEIESYENNPEEQAHDLIAETVWPNHPLGRPILGSRETINSFGTRDLKRYHGGHYTPRNVLVAASGGVTLEQLTDLVQRHVKLPAGPRHNGRFPLTRFRARAVQFDKEVTQVSLALAGRGPSYFDDDRHSLAIVNMVLGAGLSSRLFQRIREEEGLAYTIYSFLDVLRDTGLFGVYIGVAPENIRRSLDLTCREIRRLKKTGIRRWELESAKAQLLMNHFLAYESTYERMNRIAQYEICYGRQAPLDQVVARIQSISREQAQEAIERFLQPHRFSVVAVGPPGDDYPKVGDWDF